MGGKLMKQVTELRQNMVYNHGRELLSHMYQKFRLIQFLKKTAFLAASTNRIVAVIGNASIVWATTILLGGFSVQGAVHMPDFAVIGCIVTLEVVRLYVNSLCFRAVTMAPERTKLGLLVRRLAGYIFVRLFQFLTAAGKMLLCWWRVILLYSKDRHEYTSTLKFALVSFYGLSLLATSVDVVFDEIVGTGVFFYGIPCHLYRLGFEKYSGRMLMAHQVMKYWYSLYVSGVTGAVPFDVFTDSQIVVLLLKEDQYCLRNVDNSKLYSDKNQFDMFMGLKVDGTVAQVTEHDSGVDDVVRMGFVQKIRIFPEPTNPSDGTDEMKKRPRADGREQHVVYIADDTVNVDDERTGLLTVQHVDSFRPKYWSPQQFSI